MARRSIRRRRSRRASGRRYRRNPTGFGMGGGKMLGGFVNTAQLTQAGIAVGGFVGTTWLLSKLDKQNKLTGWSRIAAKAGLAIAAGIGLKMLKVPTAIAAGVALGGLVSAGLEAANRATDGKLKGLGEYGVDGTDQYPSEGQSLGELPPGTVFQDESGRTFQVVAEQ